MQGLFPDFINIALQQKLLDLSSKTTNGNNITTFHKIIKTTKFTENRILRADVNEGCSLAYPLQTRP